MNPEIQKLNGRIEALEKKLKLLESYTTIPYQVDNAFRQRLGIKKFETLPTGLHDAPFPSVAAPSGGATVDTQSRNAINAIITNLEDAGIQLPN